MINDVIIVGGGPAGLSAALILARCRRRVVVIDAGNPRNAAAREFHGYLGRDGMSPSELLRDGRAELAKYEVEVLHDLVVHAECASGALEDARGTRFSVSTQTGQTFLARKLLLATGTRDELPPFEGLRECYGISVHHCPYCDGWEHRDQHLLAYGDNPSSAIGLAELLSGWSKQVTVLTNGQRASEEERQRLQRSGLAIREAAIEALLHTDGRLQAIQLHAAEPLAAEALFFNSSQRPQSELSMMLGCEMANEFITRTGRRQTTNVPGLFLAGDADGEVQFVIVAAGEGATAAVAINRELQSEDHDR